jgi:hypothetical protein
MFIAIKERDENLGNANRRTARDESSDTYFLWWNFAQFQ